MSDDLLPALAAFSKALAAPDGQPRTTLAALHTLTDTVLGAKLFTVLLLDYDNGVMRRLYSSNHEIYPEGGNDPIGDTVWERTIIGEKKPLVMKDYEALKQLLPEHAQLKALGCGAMLNLPIVVNGVTMGTLNMLHDDNHYNADRLIAAAALQPAAAICLFANLLASAKAL